MGTDLEIGQKIFVMESLVEMKFDEGTVANNNRLWGMWLLVMQAVMAAVVPILIPIGNNYSSSEDLPRKRAGEIISFANIACSLIGTICLVIEKTRKFGDVGFEIFKNNSAIHQELDYFLGLAGDRYKVYRDQGRSHKEAFHLFMERYADLGHAGNIGRNNVYHGGGPNVDKDQSSQWKQVTPDNLERGGSVKQPAAPEGHYSAKQTGKPNGSDNLAQPIPHVPQASVVDVKAPELAPSILLQAITSGQ